MPASREGCCARGTGAGNEASVDWRGSGRSACTPELSPTCAAFASLGGARSSGAAETTPAYLVAMRSPYATSEARPMAVRRFIALEFRPKPLLRQRLLPAGSDAERQEMPHSA